MNQKQNCTCPKCGKEVISLEVPPYHCTHCGSGKTCPICGEGITLDREYCAKCQQVAILPGYLKLKHENELLRELLTMLLEKTDIMEKIKHWVKDSLKENPEKGKK